MKKRFGLIALVAAILLVLAGCINDAQLVRDALSKSIDKTNYQFKAHFALKGDQALLKGTDADPLTGGLIDTMYTGVNIEGTRYDLQHAKVTVSAIDQTALVQAGLWPAAQGTPNAEIEVLLDKSKAYLKSPVDSKYLFLDGSTEMDAEEASKITDLQQQMDALLKDFFVEYIKNYGFVLSNVEVTPNQTIEINGANVDTTKITINLGLEELISMVHWTLDDATTNQLVKEFAVDYLTLTFKAMDSEDNPVDDEMAREMAQDSVETAISLLEDFLKDYDQQKMLQEIQDAGLQNLTLKLDYFIDGNSNMVRTAADFDVSVKDPTEETGKTYNIGFVTNQDAWNFSNAPEIAYPSGSDAVKISDIEENMSLLDNFNKDGFVYQGIVESLISSVESTIAISEEIAYWGMEDIETINDVQSNINKAKKIVNGLPAGTKKNELTARLTALQKEVDKAKKPRLEKVAVDADGVINVTINGVTGKLYVIVKDSKGKEKKHLSVQKGKNLKIKGLTAGKYTVSAQAVVNSTTKYYSTAKSVTITKNMLTPPIPSKVTSKVTKGSKTTTVKVTVAISGGYETKAEIRLVSPGGKVIARKTLRKTGSNVQWEFKIDNSKVRRGYYKVEVKGQKYGKSSKVVTKRLKLR